MKKGKNFFYRIEPMAVLSEMICVPDSDRGQWAVTFFKELQKGIIEETTTEIAADIIREAHEYRARRANAGSQGGVAKASNAIAKASNAIAKASNAIIPASNDVAISSKQLAVTETIKPTTATTRTEEIFIECFAQNHERLKELYPHADFLAERETCIAHYRAGNPPIDCYPVILKWFQRVPKEKNNGNRHSGSAAYSGKKTGIIEANGAGTDFLS